MRLLYVFGNLKVSFFPLYSCSGGTSVIVLPLFFLLNCEKWSTWAQVLEPGGLCFFMHVHQKPSSLCSKWPFHYLTFMADVEGGSSKFKPATHQLIRFYGINSKSRPVSVRECLGVFSYQKFPIRQSSNCLLGNIQLEYVSPADILQLHLQIRPDTRKLCSFTPGSAVWDCLKPNLHPCVGFVWVVQFQIQELSLCPCSW